MQNPVVSFPSTHVLFVRLWDLCDTLGASLLSFHTQSVTLEAVLMGLPIEVVQTSLGRAGVDAQLGQEDTILFLGLEW